MCGEKSFSKSPASSRRGSPPRVRGKGGIGIYSTFTHGITPACAGKSCSGCCSCSCAGDHPRVCGEKSKEVAEYASKAGSPPRVRGKVEPFKGSMYQSRITPACAGKSSVQGWTGLCGRDHPRVCGEKSQKGLWEPTTLGSPPRVRGKGPPPRYSGTCTGITPACAGKRLKRSHSIGHFSCILCLFHSVLHRASVSGGSRAGPCAPPCLPAQNAVPV